jgi:hypothetical protein
MKRSEGCLVNRLWAGGYLEERCSGLVARTVALATEIRAARREEWGAAVAEETTRTTAKATTNTRLTLNTQEANTRAIVPLFPPGNMVRSPVIRLSFTRVFVWKCDSSRGWPRLERSDGDLHHRGLPAVGRHYKI